jgi:hypothetical protein
MMNTKLVDFKIELTNGDVFYVRALDAMHARQVAGRKLRANEEIARII